ncbi:Glutathione S-transferase [Pseudovibrio axinellae]|uniref:Glutathione S-transferase n=1 Tax=Pseudovibrio axinellae TaxID=989403 RepID=A0A165YBK2_9HYPH|nr:glutathione S-transferase family protein [Pseudovibrio axinellae]KZL18641.1 Glutathione S-transferase [Pseudovibrio axinellae]SER73624.1 glutathione S-transferase [Pseudovibrio axinellae]
MKVHGLIMSPNVRKVIVALNAKGIAFENIQVFPGTHTPEFLKISPRGMIPAFEDGDFAFSDSAVIMEYLEEKFPETSLMPSGPKNRALSRWFTEYGGSVVFPPCGTIFTQLMANPYYFKRPTDQAAVDDAITEKLPPILDYLESHVPDTGFLFGELGVADISLLSPFINAEYGGYEIDAAKWPQMAAYYQRGKAHPAFMSTLIEEDKLRQAIMAQAS